MRIRAIASFRLLRFLCLFAILATTLLLAVAVYQRFLRRNPNDIAIEPPNVDFGEVGQHQTLTCNLAFRNRSNVAVEIVDARTDCSCSSTPDLIGAIVQPGEAITFPKTLTTGHADEAVSGLTLIYYRWLDRPADPPRYAATTLRAKIIPDFRIRPNFIDFGVIEDYSPVKTTLRLRPYKLPNVKMTRLWADRPELSVREVPIPESAIDQGIEVTFSSASSTRSGQVTGSITLTTTSKTAPSCSIPVSAFFRPPIEVEPTSIVIGAEAKGAVDKVIQVKTKGAFRLRTANATSPMVKVAILDSTDNKEMSVKATIPTSSPGKPFECDIRLEFAPVTGTAETRLVTIPVFRLD